MTVRKIGCALLSVSDKAGLTDLAKELVSHQVELISTGGTARTLKDAGFPVRDVSEVTEFPEILDGRVKSLHPRIHGGILALRDNDQHQQTLREQGIKPIDLVVCNLYPFEETLRQGKPHPDIIENIDIGGPAMIRAAAKNYSDVAVVTSPDQYGMILEEMKTNDGGLSLATREKLASAAFVKTAAYDRAIGSYFLGKEGEQELFPAQLGLHFERRLSLRYGENPHQQAAFYVEPGQIHPSVSSAEQLHGKELSYNNLLDLDSAFNLAKEFSAPASVVIKHNNPCGTAIADSLKKAFAKAYEGDPVSAFGGVLAFNRELDEETAEQITEPNRFIECIIAPGFSDKAFQLLTTRPSWKKNVRILKTAPLTSSDHFPLDYRRVDGGLLVQSRDVPKDDFANLQVVTNRPPTDPELADLRFAWLVCKHVKSNAIVLAKGGMIRGVGAGQMSRVDSVHLAVRKAGEEASGCVLASDAFFPFRDNIDEAHKAGIQAIVQPGGSKRDQDSIDACNEFGMAMVFTGVRHFRH